MASDEEYEIPSSGAVFTFGRSGFAENHPSHFFIRNDPVVEVSCGDEHTAVVCKNGRVFLFGHNDYGQLGFGHTRIITKPSCLKYLKPFHSEHVACGKGHTIVSTECGRLFSFGSNSDGQLGLGNLEDKLIPELINTEALNGNRILAVSAGCLHSACLTENGDLFVWGSNSDGQCGIDGDSHLLTPKKIAFERPIESISCGYYHSAFISEGVLYTFGEEDNGKLGYRKTDSNNAPRKVELDFESKAIACGGSHSIILSDEGKVYSFGSNFSGQLGIGNGEAESYVPTQIDLSHDLRISAISAGESHSAFITENGELFVCGDGRHGKVCGEEGSIKYASPVLISLFAQFYCSFVSCGGCHTMVIARAKTENEVTEPIQLKSKNTVLPPVKTRKTLDETDNTKDDPCAVEDSKSNEKAEDEERAIADVHEEEPSPVGDIENETDASSELVNHHSCDVYVNIEEMERSNAEESVIESEANISKTASEEGTENENEVIAAPKGRIGKWLARFRKKPISAVLVEQVRDKEVIEKEIEFADSMVHGKNGHQHRSKTCTVL